MSVSVQNPILVNSISKLMASKYKHHSKIKQPTSSVKMLCSQVKSKRLVKTFHSPTCWRDLPFFLKLAPPGGLVIYSLNKLFMNEY